MLCCLRLAFAFLYLQVLEVVSADFLQATASSNRRPEFGGAPRCIRV